MEIREGDGVYITYADGADTVSKKLGSVNYIDVSIPDGRESYTVNISDYVQNAEIVGAGAIGRTYYGWTGLNISYTSKNATFTFGIDGSRVVQSTGGWRARIWYI